MADVLLAQAACVSNHMIPLLASNAGGTPGTTNLPATEMGQEPRLKSPAELQSISKMMKTLEAVAPLWTEPRIYVGREKSKLIF